jgi:hypothetical protein
MDSGTNSLIGRYEHLAKRSQHEKAKYVFACENGDSIQSRPNFSFYQRTVDENRVSCQTYYEKARLDSWDFSRGEITQQPIGINLTNSGHIAFAFSLYLTVRIFWVSGYMYKRKVEGSSNDVM